MGSGVSKFNFIGFGLFGVCKLDLLTVSFEKQRCFTHALFGVIGENDGLASSTSAKNRKI